MLIIDSITQVKLSINNHKEKLSIERYAKFLRILKENNVSEAHFLTQESSSIVLIGENDLLICYMKDIAGLRLLVLNNSHLDYSLINESVWNSLEIVAINNRADLIQMEIPAEKIKNFNFCRNILIENYVFERNVEPIILSTKVETAPLNFNDKIVMQRLAEIEFITRLDFPSSTVREKDKFSVILDEYLSFSSTPGMNGLCIENDPLKGFIIWWTNVEKKTTAVFYAWVSEKYRGNDYGQSLVEGMINQLASEGIIICNYFVGATNIASIKNAMKSKFSLTFFILNRHVGK